MFDTTKIGKRIKELRGATSQDQCAKNLGISRGALSFYENGDRKPDAEVLYKMCKQFSVSADYILGLSDVKSPDIDKQTVCKVTGLSEKATDNIVELHEIHKNDDCCKRRGCFEILNSFLEDRKFFVALFWVFDWVLNKLIRSCEKDKLVEFKKDNLNKSQYLRLNKHSRESIEEAGKLLNHTGYGIIETGLIDDVKIRRIERQFFLCCLSIYRQVEIGSKTLECLKYLDKKDFDIEQYYDIISTQTIYDDED